MAAALSPLFPEVFINGIQEFFGVEVMLAMVHFIAMYANSKIFSHFSTFYCFNTNSFQCITEVNQFLITIQFAAES